MNRSLVTCHVTSSTSDFGLCSSLITSHSPLTTVLRDVAVINEATPQPGHAVNLRALPCGGNDEPNRRALAGAKNRGNLVEVSATLAEAFNTGYPPARLHSEAAGCILLITRDLNTEMATLGSDF